MRSSSACEPPPTLGKRVYLRVCAGTMSTTPIEPPLAAATIPKGLSERPLDFRVKSTYIGSNGPVPVISNNCSHRVALI